MHPASIDGDPDSAQEGSPEPQLSQEDAQPSSELKAESPSHEAPASDYDEASAADAASGDESASADDDVSPVQKQLNLTPRTIVLAKVKGYRAWPAMVLAENILPDNIRQMKPKSVKLAKKKGPVISVPVRFFSDDTYIWMKSCDLKLLPKAEIDAFLDKRAGVKKHDALIDAYRLAQDPPDMVEFNLWGSAGPPAAELDEQPRKKLKLSIKLKKAPTKSKAKKPEAFRDNGSVNYVDDFEEESESSDDMEGYDSDWGLDGPEYSYEDGDYLFEDKGEQQEFATLFPRAAELATTLAEYNDQLAGIHTKVSLRLLVGDIASQKEVVKHLRDLEKLLSLGKMPLIAFTKSVLYRVLLLSMHRPKEDFPFDDVRRAIGRTLDRVPLQTCELKPEDLVVPTQEATPLPEEDSPLHDTNGDTETTAGPSSTAGDVTTAMPGAEPIKAE